MPHLRSPWTHWKLWEVRPAASWKPQSAVLRQGDPKIPEEGPREGGRSSLTHLLLLLCTGLLMWAFQLQGGKQRCLALPAPLPFLSGYKRGADAIVAANKSCFCS